MNEIIIDLETKETFDEVGAYNAELLHISLAGTYISELGKYVAYREEELKNLWPYLERADVVVGYNLKGFDWPVIKKYYPAIDSIPTLDLMEVIKNQIGYRPKLDDIAKANLSFSKSGDGLMAVKYYKQGDWENLEKYCLDDVKVTKEIYELGKKNKKLNYIDKATGEKKEVEVNFTLSNNDQKKAVNFTLPF